MKIFTLLCALLGLNELALGQTAYEPSTAYPFGRANPNAPTAMTDYESMMGISQCLSTSRRPDGTWAESVGMTWEFRYIMNGTAVQDLTLKADGSHAGSIRQFNADSSQWYVHYFSTGAALPQLPAWKGGMQGDEIVLYRGQKAPNGAEGNYRLTFHEITNESFKWKGEWVSLDESIVYPTWTIECRKQ